VSIRVDIKWILTIVFGAFLAMYVHPPEVSAQELDVNVELNKSQINASSVGYIDELDQKIETYVNDYDWIDDEFMEKERIKATFNIALRSYDASNSSFTATLVITSTRPIYNTMQSTQLAQIKDNNWDFAFKKGTNLTHDELQYSNIESVIDYYVYVILGLDYDSFASTGGSSYFNEAQSIVDLAQSSGGSGWSRSSSDNYSRYSFVNDMQSTGYQRFREAMYRYHRHGLDQFINDPEEARKEVLKALQLIQEAKRNTTKNYPFDIFFSTKYNEIVSIFKEADTQIRLEAYNLLTEIDPGHTSTYGELQQGS